MAVDYNAGASAGMAASYADLRQALAGKGDAENSRRAKDIENEGFLGSGIKQSDIQDFGNLAIKGAEFGEGRMNRKMDRASASFNRRQGADQRRLATLKSRYDKDMLDPKGIKEMDGIEMGMAERRNSFEDFMGKYEEKGLFGTGFGGDDVGYRSEGETEYSKAMARKDTKKNLISTNSPDMTKNAGNQFDDGRSSFTSNPNNRYGMSEYYDRHGDQKSTSNPNNKYGMSEYYDRNNSYPDDPNNRGGLMNIKEAVDQEAASPQYSDDVEKAEQQLALGQYNVPAYTNDERDKMEYAGAVKEKFDVEEAQGNYQAQAQAIVENRKKNQLKELIAN
tara:strand:+ start:22 stop:1026 length:1005 start_codon:yes stop_codon:yes gene_type:complete